MLVLTTENELRFEVDAERAVNAGIEISLAESLDSNGPVMADFWVCSGHSRSIWGSRGRREDEVRLAADVEYEQDSSEVSSVTLRHWSQHR